MSLVDTVIVGDTALTPSLGVVGGRLVPGPVTEGDRIWMPGILHNLVKNGEFRFGEHAEGYTKNVWCAGGSTLHTPGWEPFALFGRRQGGSAPPEG